MKNVTPRLDGDRVHAGKVEDVGFSKSGFNLSYTSYNDLILGRVHCLGRHVTMPGDKFSGSNSGQFTLNEVTTPILSPLNVSSFNFYIPYRALDRSFEEAFAPTKNNQMSSAWVAPSFTLQTLVRKILEGLNGGLGLDDGSHQFRDDIFSVLGAPASPSMSAAQVTAYNSVFNHVVAAYSGQLSNPMSKMMNDVYILDQLADFNDYIAPFKTVSTSTALRTAKIQMYLMLFKIWIGESSLLDELGYSYLRLADIYHLADASLTLTDAQSFYDLFDDIPQNEYALRAYTCIWVEWLRQVDLEPMNDKLKWKDWSSSPVVKDNLWMLLHRQRAWRPDMFIQASPDDICRHIFAPIIKSFDEIVSGISEPYNYLDAQSFTGDEHDMPGVNSYSLRYYDPLTHNTKSVVCPVPSVISDALTDDDSNSYSSFGLDLFNLRQAQNAERYLKRNFYFNADEYQSYIMAQYETTVRDLRVNRPELLGASLNNVDYAQQIANVSTDATQAGTRTATGQVNIGGDHFNFFAEEFGIVLNLVTVVPDAMYAGLDPHHLHSKMVDWPIPVFSANNEEFGRAIEIATNGLAKKSVDSKLIYCFGHYPYAHAWRSRTNEVHGSFLSSRQNYTFRRFFDLDSNETTPQLNYQFVHCFPTLAMFANQIRLDGQMYGYMTHNFYVERVLPTPPEVI